MQRPSRAAQCYVGLRSAADDALACVRQSTMVQRVVDFAKLRFRPWRLAFFHWRLVAAVAYDAAHHRHTALKLILLRHVRVWFRRWQAHYEAASKEEQHTLRSMNAAASIRAIATRDMVIPVLSRF